MILLAFLALVQVCFLPGWLVLRPFAVPDLLARALLIFPLSLLANYELVYLLTLVGAYQRPVVFGIFGAEVVAAIWLLFRRPAAPETSDENSVREQVGDWPEALPLRHILFTVAVLLVAALALEWARKIPGVFGIGDDIVSWNRWALDWFAGRVSARSGYYPQIIPANWSLIYQFTGTAETHIFAKSFMGLFAVGVPLIFIAAFQATRSIACLAAVPVFVWMLGKLLGLYIGEGWVDIPLAFAGAATWLVFVLHHSRRLALFPTVVLSTLLAATATLIKQGGALILLASLIWNVVILLRSRADRQTWTRSLTAIAVAAGVLVAPWFIFKWQLVSAKTERSEWEYQTKQLHRGRSYGERLERATVAVVAKLSGLQKSKPLTNGAVAAFALCALLALRNPLGRQSLALGLPLYLLWGTLFSYDQRNAAAALPFLALTIGTGLVEGAELLFRHRSSAPLAWLFRARSIAIGAALALACGLVGLNARVSRADILGKQDALMRQIAYPQVNALIYEHIHREGLHGAILTDYQQLNYLPELSGSARFYQMTFPGTLTGFLSACAKLGEPRVRYVLFREDAEREIVEYSEKNFRSLFRQMPFRFYEIPETWTPPPIP